MKIKSITAANGWYRVVGVSAQSYVLEEIAVFAVIENGGDSETSSDDIVVGIPAQDFSVSGNEVDQYLHNIVGYVREAQTERSPSGSLLLKNPEDENLVWQE